MSQATAQDKARDIKLIIFDVDGILTNGHLYYSDDGIGMKAFHVHDGVGIKLLQAGGIEVGIITAHQSNMIDQRMEDLGIKYVYKGYRDKRPAYNDMLMNLNITPKNVCYVGDDLPDLPLMMQSRLGITVPNAVREVKQRACWRTDAQGGQGAVREIAEMILTAQNKYDDILAPYLEFETT